MYAIRRKEEKEMTLCVTNGLDLKENERKKKKKNKRNILSHLLFSLPINGNDKFPFERAT